jgi:hypothetical protein
MRVAEAAPAQEAQGNGPMSDHLAKTFEQEIVRLKTMVTQMGNLTIDQLDTVLEAAEQPDSDLATHVIQR